MAKTNVQNQIPEELTDTGLTWQHTKGFDLDSYSRAYEHRFGSHEVFEVTYVLGRLAEVICRVSFPSYREQQFETLKDMLKHWEAGPYAKQTPA